MGPDRFSSIAALKAALQEHRDYRIAVLNRKSWLTVLSPHGGFIEEGTSAIARAVAGRAYNLFDFQGLDAILAKEMHVTSTRFRDPALKKLLLSSCAALSIHWMGTCHQPVVWLGGLNSALKGLVHERLCAEKFAVNPDSPKYKGEDPRNVVNLACHQGVQLEISDELVGEFFLKDRFFKNNHRPKTTPRFHQFVSALRQAAKAFRKNFACRGPCSRKGKL